MAADSFKVIVVGGSVAGLTLAHSLASAGIDFVLLEGRDNIAPKLGATIVMMPNGTRVLDQLGIYQSMGDIMTEGTVHVTRRSDGSLIGRNGWPAILKDRLGYSPGIFLRQEFLQRLYDKLDDKSKGKILLSKKVTEIVNFPGTVVAKCADGTEFTGDIIVGADGIHSRVRREMQRLMEESGKSRDSDPVFAEYNCIFGVSSTIAKLELGSVTTARDIGHCSLFFVVEDRCPQWFFISKMDKKEGERSIPRYTKSQMESAVSKYADFQLSEGVTLRELVASATQISYQALEEAHYEAWTHERIVCLGDSIHKMTPNFGQGGNQAIESVAVLTNCLVEVLSSLKSKTHRPSDLDMYAALQKYQHLRQDRSKTFVNLSGIITRDEALDTLSHTLRFLFFPPFTTEQLSDMQTSLYRDAPMLKHLRYPERLLGNKIWRDIAKLEKTVHVKAQL